MSYLLRSFFFLFLIASFTPAGVYAQDANGDSTSAEETADEAAGNEEDDILMEESEMPEDDDTGENIIKADDEEEKQEKQEKQEKVLTLEEARNLVEDLPTASDAVSGTIPVDPDVGAYDIYGRQQAYRENAKELRSSLEQRRENFEQPRIENIKRYRDAQKKIYAAESKAFQDKQDAEKEKKDAEKNKKLAKEVSKPSAEKEKQDKELQEREIPPREGEEVTKRKKVVTAPDAPDFDPANLPNAESPEDDLKDISEDIDALDDTREDEASGQDSARADTIEPTAEQDNIAADSADDLDDLVTEPVNNSAGDNASGRDASTRADTIESTAEPDNIAADSADDLDDYVSEPGDDPINLAQ